MTPLLSIIIPNGKRRDLLRTALASMRECCDLSDTETIIVDWDSQPLGEVPEVPRCRVIPLLGGGFPSCVNAAAQVARGEYLLLLNDDVIATSDVIAEMVAFSHAHGNAIVGARLLYPNGLIQHAGVGFDIDGNPYHLWHNAPAEHPGAMTPRFLPSVTFALALIPMSVWQSVGGLDEALANAYNDVDYCLRAREQGVPVWYDPAAVAIHVAGATRNKAEADALAWPVLAGRWIGSGRLSYVLGSWPFSVRG